MLFAIEPYVDVLIVVDVPTIPCLVARIPFPAALYNFTVYDDAPTTASHETSRDFAVEAVVVTVIEVGDVRVTGGAITDTATLEFNSVPSPSDPCWFRPQHLMVESLRTAQVWTYPEEIWLTPVTP